MAINLLEDFLALGLLLLLCKNCTFFFPLHAPLIQVLMQSQRVLNQNALSGPIPATWSSLPPAFPDLEYLCVHVFLLFFFWFILPVQAKIIAFEWIERTPSFWLVCSQQSGNSVSSFFLHLFFSHLTGNAICTDISLPINGVENFLVLGLLLLL